MIGKELESRFVISLLLFIVFLLAFFIYQVFYVVLIAICIGIVIETINISMLAYNKKSLPTIVFVMIAASVMLFSGQYLYLMNKGLFVAIVVSIAAADIFAYFFGKKFGKNKLAPKISPGKTWEGFFAGLSASVLIFVIISALKIITISVEHALLLGLLVSFTSVGGDLFESKIKREFNVKDSGTLLGAHGGIFDRFDSYVFSIPITTLLYYFLPH